MEIHGTAICSSGKFDSVKNVKEIIAPKLMGRNILNQREIDKIMIELDGTEKKERLGSGTMFAVSVAVARAASANLEIPVSQYLGGISGRSIPCPIINILTGKKIDTYMITPVDFLDSLERIKACIRVSRKLKELLLDENFEIGMNEEGAYVTNIESNDLALGLLKKAISESGYNTDGFEITSSLPQNSLLIIPCEIGTITESIHSIRTAKETGNLPVVSLSMVETEDSFVVDLCTAINVKFLKIGMPIGCERTSKYNELLRLSDIL